MQHQVVLGAQFRSQRRVRGQHRVGGGAIAARARGDEALERRKFVGGAVREQPGGDVVVAWSSASVCGVAPSARRRETSAPCATSRSTIGTSHRRAATCSGASPAIAPREIGVGAVLEQPARPGGIVGPQHHVDERRHAAGNAVRRSRRSDAAVRARRDCRRRRRCATSRRQWGWRRPRAALRPAADVLTAQIAPHNAVRGSSGCQFQWYSALGFAPSAQSRRAIVDEPVDASRGRAGASTCGRRRAAAPSSAVRPAASRAPDGCSARPRRPRRRRAPAPCAAWPIAMRGWSASNRSARPAAPPVAQRMNSSTAASNDSVRDSTSSRSAFQDRNPCSRAIDRLRVVQRQIDRADLVERLARERRQNGESPERVRVARLRGVEQRLRLLLQLFEIRTGGQLACVIQPPCLSPVVRRQAARRLCR